jgi:hypothetical protein
MRYELSPKTKKEIKLVASLLRCGKLTPKTEVKHRKKVFVSKHKTLDIYLCVDL